MTARLVALGWASCLGLGLLGMIAVSGWAFIDHLDHHEEGLVVTHSALPESVPAGSSSVSPILPGATSTPIVPEVADSEMSAAPEAPDSDPSLPELRVAVRNGDSLSAIFDERGLSPQDLQYIVSASERAGAQLSGLRPGDEVLLEIGDDGSVHMLSHLRDGDDALEIERQPDGDFTAMWSPRQVPDTPESPPAMPAAQRAAEALEQGLALHGWNRREVRVASGDSLYGIFLAEDLPVAELIDLLRSGEDARVLKRLRPDQQLEIYVDGGGSVRHLVYHPDEIESLHFFRQEGEFRSERHRAELDRQLASANGEIHDSFYLAARRSGLSDRLTMEMAEIFGWDIDFALDIRGGDRFSAIYEKLYQTDGTVSDGAILAAEFVNRDRTIRALRYEDESGSIQYYSPEGTSMRKAFLRTPVNFTRISSRYGLRHHPILHKLRHHNGVDYAAPRGTPVRATGDGRVEFVGRKGGYGRTIILRHGNQYTTLYAHLSGYAKGLKRGDSVEQGQMIGRVGSSGLSTGPHLHYEFRVRDRHRDPLKVKLPDAPPIPAKYRDDFFERTRSLLARLEHLSRTHLASNN